MTSPASETSSAIPPARTTSASGWRTALVRALTTTASNTMSIPIFISATVICVAGMMICIVYSKNMILAHGNLRLAEDKIRLEKENENNKSRLEKENENNKSRLEKENSKLDTELKEVKAKHEQLISEYICELKRRHHSTSSLAGQA
ncbi:hypothetical protein KEM48_003190 [Puccinia striiformis f. sp. tritici PST-130]|nr:hypothetical protein KEM48_003190 [Puccinia striiformis f. sp. tritici PST-130]